MVFNPKNLFTNRIRRTNVVVNGDGLAGWR
jgi:hypothetical protein